MSLPPSCIAILGPPGPSGRHTGRQQPLKTIEKDRDAHHLAPARKRNVEVATFCLWTPFTGWVGGTDKKSKT